MSNTPSKKMLRVQFLLVMLVLGGFISLVVYWLTDVVALRAGIVSLTATIIALILAGATLCAFLVIGWESSNG